RRSALDRGLNGLGMDEEAEGSRGGVRRRFETVTRQLPPTRGTKFFQFAGTSRGCSVSGSTCPRPDVGRALSAPTCESSHYITPLNYPRKPKRGFIRPDFRVPSGDAACDYDIGKTGKR